MGQLEDRIAAVIRREVPCHPPAADRIACEVIRELGLRIQVAGPDGIVGTGDYRYVTEWETTK